VATLRSPMSAVTLLVFLALSMILILGTYLSISDYAKITQHYHDISLAEFHFDDQTLESDIGGYVLTAGGAQDYNFVEGYINLGVELNNTRLRTSIGTQTRTTATVWFKPDANTALYSTIIRVDYSNGDLRAQIQYVDSNTVRIRISLYGTTVINELIDVNNINGWHLYAVTVDWATNEEIFYVDGIEIYRANVTVPSRLGVTVQIGDLAGGIMYFDELLIFPLNDPNVIIQVADSVHYYLPEDLRNTIRNIVAIIIVSMLLLLIKAAFTAVKRTNNPLNIPPGYFYNIIVLFFVYAVFTAMITISAMFGVNVISFLNITATSGLMPKIILMLWAGLLAFWGLILYVITSYT